jgi:alpha-tubulin suppressor-like RCC1 family protein
VKVECTSIAQNGIDLFSISIIVSCCSHRDRNQPVLLKDVEGSNDWCRVACGPNHTALVTTGGDIYSCGNGAVDQLGYGEGHTIISNKPKQFKSLAEKIDVVEATCGPLHTAIITRTGHLYTWCV